MRFLLFAILSFVLTIPAQALPGSYSYQESAGTSNAANIATNVTNIATNASDIDTIELEVDSLFAGGATTYVEITGDTMTGSLTLAGLFVDTVTARGATGLHLHEDGGAGIFIKNGGNVGIGNDAPNEKLDVTGTIEGHDFIASLANPIYLLEDITAGDDDFRMAANGDVLSIEQKVGDTTWTEYFRLTGGAFNWGTAVYKSTLSALGELAIPGTLDCATINTGLGDFEIGQDLDTGDNVTFAGVTANLTGNVTGSSLTAVDASGAWVCDDGGNCLHVKNGGNVGIGTTNPDGNLNIEKAGGDVSLRIKTYSDNLANRPSIRSYRSHSNTHGTLATTQDTEKLFEWMFFGVGSTGASRYGANILLQQDGAAGGDNIPANFIWDTHSATGKNEHQLVLHHDGGVGISTLTPIGLFMVGPGATPALLVASDGNVGIGTIDPLYSLHVASTAYANELIVAERIIGTDGSYVAKTREAMKTANESVQNNTLQNDDELVIANITAGTTQHIHLSVGILQGSDINADFDYTIDFTNAMAGGIHLNCKMFEKTGMTFMRYDTDNEEVNMDLNVDDEAMLECDGIVYFDGEGTIQFTWAQEITTAVDTTVLIGSHIEIHEEY